MITPESTPEGDAFVHVTAVPEIFEVQFTDADGEPFHPAMEFVQPATLGGFVMRLSTLYGAIGPREFRREEATAVEGMTGMGVSVFLRRAMDDAPDAVLSHHVEGTQEVYRFGYFAVSERGPTDEERAAYAEYKRAAGDAEKAEIIAADREKTNISMYDHAVISVGEQAFNLALDNNEAVMAARVMLALEAERHGRGPGRHIIDIRDLTAAVWQAMPLAERQLYVKQSTDVIYRNSDRPVRQTVDRTLGQFTTLIGATRRAELTQSFRYLEDKEIGVTLVLAPPAEPYDQQVIRPIVPPGTSHERLKELSGSQRPVEREVMDDARRLVDMAAASGRSRLTQTDAIGVLDFIMSPEGKRALQLVLGGQEGTTVDSVIGTLQARVRLSIGNEPFYAAYRDRVIAGNVVSNRHRHVLQVGGRLRPDITMASTGYTKTWKLVSPSSAG